MSKVKKLETKPEFYNTITNNCFTSLLMTICHLMNLKINTILINTFQKATYQITIQE